MKNIQPEVIIYGAGTEPGSRVMLRLLDNSRGICNAGFCIACRPQYKSNLTNALVDLSRNIVDFGKWVRDFWTGFAIVIILGTLSLISR